MEGALRVRELWELFAKKVWMLVEYPQWIMRVLDGRWMAVL